MSLPSIAGNLYNHQKVYILFKLSKNWYSSEICFVASFKLKFNEGAKLFTFEQINSILSVCIKNFSSKPLCSRISYWHKPHKDSQICNCLDTASFSVIHIYGKIAVYDRSCVVYVLISSTGSSNFHTIFSLTVVPNNFTTPLWIAGLK